MQVQGNGTTTGSAFLVENSAGTDRFEVLDNGQFNISGSAGSSGQALVSAGTGSPPTWSTLTTYYAPSVLSANATDADFTADVNAIRHIPDGVLTANRNVTIPTGSNGDVILLLNNEDTYTLTLIGATVYFADRTTVVTQLLFNVPTQIQKINGVWVILN